MDPIVVKGVELIRESEKILVFSGAGLSTESGIPDFRSPGGVWDKYDPADFTFQKFISDQKARVTYWEMSSEFYQGMKDAVPNRAHLAIAELEGTGKLLAIVTQNVDRLHHKAGNSPDKIIEIHGTTFSVSCLSCKKGYDRDEIEERLRSGVKVPYCDDCSGILKPDTISFGQAMPEDKMSQSLAHARNCDLCIVLGSSLVVYPAASIPIQAVETGAKLMIINRDETPLDPHAALIIHDSVARILGQIMEKLLH
ncbi:MAG: Sir2 family NAD-dependent protein deacetylase [Desulfobacteraceae bacterium]|jgi:NAD-dependent deacetylase